MLNCRRVCLLALVGLAGLHGCVPPSSVPTVRFAVELMTAATVQVEAPGGWIEYEWRFGDGSVADGQRATHTYASPGEYTIDLKVVGVDNVVAFDHRFVEVHRDIRVPGDYLTIQFAVDAAEPGDMILIEGEHVGNTVIDEAITLRGPCTLSSATADPAIRVSANGVVLEDLAFEWGEDEATAGSALRIDGVAIDVVDCSFEGHSGSSGGAVYAMESDALFSDCTFFENRADVDGGAVYCEGDRVFPTFLRCTFADNTADAGGGIAVRATTACALDAQPLRVEDCVFERNRASGAQAGGAIHVGVSCRTVLSGNTFSANGVLEVVYE